ncbi:SGNH/GDSL hydrolase family protein [Bacillus aerolatus]|uniref:SGNH/GDSL hydrolase family protein n=1 Tax=Bacillus aerolatus TaxID=2653354 RepID=A0A6I1FL30_9BACI|nr:GDSL-type esterase/lipase family protein [Bacillus aerolatus]KAB7707538.1 SGNH/GDSL hydrolase family protein [Bacillus aerolatus]
MKKRIFLYMTAVFLLASSILPVKTYAAGIQYVALGDSLAAGQTPNKEIGASYTDLIAFALQQTGQLSSFSKNLAFPGYSTEQVLEQLEKKKARALIQKADLITISAGANDLLPLIQNDAVRGMLSYEAIPVAFSLNRVRKNYIKLFEQIRAINPHADIYAMGYYFPYPHVKEGQKPSVAGQLEILNKIIEQEAKKAGAHFVPVADQFGTNADSLIPNPKDVHPAPAGYLNMANSFLEVYAPGSPPIPQSVLTQLPAPIPFSKLRSGQRAETENPAAEQEKAKETEKEAEETSSTASEPIKSCKRGEYV